MLINDFIHFLRSTIIEKTCFAHNLSKMFQIFTAVHNSMF